jgi:CRP/FNR family transcriptional regulator, cyclic AMP receptor protein
MNQTYEMLKAHPFLAEAMPHELALLVECGSPVRFAVNDRIFDEGGEARSFWLIGDGRVRLDTMVLGRGPVIVETLGPGTVLGWSWLAPPYRWHFGAQAVEATTAVHMDGPAVRDMCERFPALGYRLMDRFTQVVVDRLQNTRIRLLDLYGTPR